MSMVFTNSEFNHRNDMAGYTVEAKQKDREKIMNDINAWLKAGGRIKKVGSDGRITMPMTIKNARIMLKKNPSKIISSPDVQSLLGMTAAQIGQTKKIQACRVHSVGISRFKLKGIIEIYESMNSDK